MVFGNLGTNHARARLIRQFRNAGAISAANAISADEVHRPGNGLFDRMVQTLVLVPTADGKYFLDESALRKLNQRYSMPALIVFIVLVFLIMSLAGVTTFLLARGN